MEASKYSTVADNYNSIEKQQKKPTMNAQVSRVVARSLPEVSGRQCSGGVRRAETPFLPRQ